MPALENALMAVTRTQAHTQRISGSSHTHIHAQNRNASSINLESRLSTHTHTQPHSYCDVTHFIWHTLRECVCVYEWGSHQHTDTSITHTHTHTRYKHFWRRNFLTDFVGFWLRFFLHFFVHRGSCVCVWISVCLHWAQNGVQLRLFAKSGLKGSLKRVNLVH